MSNAEIEYDTEIEASDAKHLAKIRTNFLAAAGLSEAKDAFKWVKADPKLCKKALSPEGLRCYVKGTGEIWVIRFKADIKWASVSRAEEAQVAQA
jgi:hypothetical protein